MADNAQTHGQQLEELIFKRDLNEAHLLIDFISGRTDKTLDDLSMPDPSPDKPGHLLASGEIVRRLTGMRYPPPGDSSAKSESAAFLLIVKDRLSILARPARGLTVAYTIMFAERSAWKGKAERDDSRLRLAVDTFPGLAGHARTFRHLRTGLVYLALAWLALTLLTYWQIGLNRSILQRMDHFYKERVTVIQSNPDLTLDKLCRKYVAGDQQFPSPDSDPGAVKLAAPCNHLWYVDKSRHEARADLDRVVNCSGFWPNIVIAALRWKQVMCGPPPSEQLGFRAEGHTPAPPEFRVDWQTAASVISVFSTYILPMMFGLLGTLIAALRNIQNRVRDSELAPRDLMLMVLGLPMGLVAGVAVGLFYSPTGAPVPGSAALGSDLSLTASGLGFLAGYGAEAFFRFLDSLLARAFPDRDVAPVSSAATRPLASGRA